MSKAATLPVSFQTPEAAALGASLGQAWQALSGLRLPTEVWGEIQQSYLADAAEVWNAALSNKAHETVSPLKDRRFATAAWAGDPMASFAAAMYLLNARTLMRLADSIEGDEKTRQRLRSAVQQWVDAASPSNSLALNPEVQRKAVETQGQSIALGVQQLWRDVQQGHLSQTDESRFEVGVNLAVTAGSVIYENELIQLIEYKPLTAKVYERPLLIVPPCINKFYILDLQPENSLVGYAVENGHRVFLVSWRNADDTIATKSWDDYLQAGVMAAIQVVQEVTGQEQLNTLGFCVGGTLLVSALSVLAARGQDVAASLTLLTTFLDFSDTGVLDLFIDESMVQMREVSIGQLSPGGGRLLKGSELAATFSFLRPNDLVWNYVVGNYLKGETPPPFDLLYWNSDGTNLPGPMYCWYLRNAYLENKLMQPGAVSCCGVPLDFGRIKAPAYIYGSREDHIVPWAGAYASVPLLKGEKRFVLGASGHIAGVINPPAKNKRSYWTNAKLPKQADAWLASAQEHPGSWWTDWTEWLKPLAGKEVAAPKKQGNRRYAPIEAAPGRYVLQKAQ